MYRTPLIALYHGLQAAEDRNCFLAGIVVLSGLCWKFLIEIDNLFLN